MTTEHKTLPSFETYGNYSSSNSGVHTQVFTDVEGIDYYFSYKTLVAYRKPGDRVVCRINDWGSTTGKHLNWIQPDKSKRISGAEFETQAATLSLATELRSS